MLIEVGHTKVLCNASVEEKVPPFLKGKGSGWVTAEYGMLPRATHTRAAREAAAGKQSGRTQEIQRLIGRSLRAVTDTAALGERQVTIDCDVLQADGGTRGRRSPARGGAATRWRACAREGSSQRSAARFRRRDLGGDRGGQAVLALDTQRIAAHRPDLGMTGAGHSSRSGKAEFAFTREDDGILVCPRPASPSSPIQRALG